MSRDTENAKSPPNAAVEEFEAWLFQRHSSAERSTAVLKATDAIFWPVVMRTWSSFDAIPHHLYQRRFKSLRSSWSPDYMEDEARASYDSLPAEFTAYRGGDSSRDFGLSWTLQEATAHEFARGHRNFENPNPEVLRMVAKKAEVAFAASDRGEAEIVLFRKPAATRMRRIPYKEPD